MNNESEYFLFDLILKLGSFQVYWFFKKLKYICVYTR